MKATAAALLALALAVCGTACGDSSGLLATKTVLTAARGSGFDRLAWRPYGLGGDWIYTRGYAAARVEEMPFQAFRFFTLAAAQRRLAADEPLLKEKLGASERAVLPRGFNIARLTEVRVCNVVLTSYNAHDDPALTRRFARVLDVLRHKC